MKLEVKGPGGLVIGYVEIPLQELSEALRGELEQSLPPEDLGGSGGCVPVYSGPVTAGMSWSWENSMAAVGSGAEGLVKLGTEAATDPNEVMRKVHAEVLAERDTVRWGGEPEQTGMPHSSACIPGQCARICPHFDAEHD